ncbi:MAG TPA: RcpC/CpaB family pilus assembly protein [Acidimicrobiales bacterium]|nr:RcpC/CpaB family pilus assembly protein [Acidimicrobiales bacterium]
MAVRSTSIEQESFETRLASPGPAVVRRRRALNGRAALGGLLVALAALLTFAAYRNATSRRLTAYVVAGTDLEPGQRLSPADLRLEPMQLPASLASASAFTSVGQLQGAFVVAPLRAGDLVQASSVARSGPDLVRISFAVDTTRALDGRLTAGDRVDVLATFGTGASATTKDIVPAAEVLAVRETAGSLSSSPSLGVTLGVADTAEAIAVANAANAGQLTLVSAPVDGGGA